ncbi:MAG TPA: DUF5107 domain-containing protein [Lactovum miscens]|uniref:DUF5107 domain-containing protein n=1 Tax=Lactovum miscens TaxID=190387 RepID=UPI002ED83E9E
MVKIWEEKVIIPTYPVAKPDHNPRFYEKRTYQGSSGKVYPLPVTEKIYNEKIDKEYTAVYLENKYLKIMFLPELGGRIQRALDKTNNYDFVYYNHVIKPALVGLTGPWISGGIEFNWPQHHRPSTFSPVGYKLLGNKDGSKSLWVSEIDKMYGTKGMATFTLYPDKSFIEIKGQLYNRTDLPQTFLWWANPAVPVNDHTVSVFPPDVTAVMDHGKRAVSTFPIATGEYYKVDYSSGVDISKYKNVPVPTSYMAAKSEYDFMGNYDEKRHAGLLHVADHHVSPGKKQWTWGNGDFGKAWDENLTDTDGPYIELMTGVFTDNQPDFTWLRPYEEKTFKQYFMPYKGVGYIKNATIDGAVNIERNENLCKISVYVTGEEPDAKIQVAKEGTVLFEERQELSPTSYYQTSFVLPEKIAQKDLLTLTVENAKGEKLVGYSEIAPSSTEIPRPAEAIPAPRELQTTEELFLAATHLEQYRHATSDAEEYYLEGLKRDKTDIRLNAGYGTLLYRRGQFAESEKYLRAAVKKQTWKTPNPYYGEPRFQLGLVLEIQGKKVEAFDCFYKATWNEDTQASAFYKLAALSAQKEKWLDALQFIEQSLHKNTQHMKARFLEIIILEKLGKAISEKVKEGLSIDPLDLDFTRKQAQITGNYEEYQRIMQDDLQNYLEIALDYLQFGLYEEALAVLKDCPAESPLIGYYQAYIYQQLGIREKVLESVLAGETSAYLYCFPNRLEEQVILEKVVALLPDAFYAKYYLGNLKYDKKQYDEAIVLWESAAEALNSFPTVFRNLSFAYYNKRNNPKKALDLINQAYRLDDQDTRILLEKTQLEARLKVPVAERLSTLEQAGSLINERDDLFIEYLQLLNLAGRHKEVLSLIQDRIFHPWEGGEGKVSSQYTYALTELGRKCLSDNMEAAGKLLKAATVYPRNLGEGKLPSVHDNVAHYYLGQLYDCKKDKEKADKHYLEATKGIQEPSSVLYYNDEPADCLFYQGLAYLRLGNKVAANQKFKQLIDYGKRQLNEKVSYDFFAVSAPAHSVYDQDIQEDNYIYCTYLIGLGKLGQEKFSEAHAQFEKVLEMNPAHQGATQHIVFSTEKKLP